MTWIVSHQGRGPSPDVLHGDRRVAVDPEGLRIDGRRVVPVTGELHYWRVPRDEWVERLGVMRASGATSVATYLPWIVHEQQRGAYDFSGIRDVGAFLRAAVDADLDVVLRIGPWCHGELRNGGFPDWLLTEPVRPRSDDPAYLALVSAWFERLAREVLRCSDRVLAVQVENELYDQPEHLLTLRRIAEAHGFRAPIWTATGWGGALLPRGELMPVFSGYSDGFWSDADAPWDPTFREHFLFSAVWDDPGVGADQDAGSRPQGPRADLDPVFPPATCELGGGMATAYHRRPVPAALDIAAVANVKVGNGSAWQGFYMYGGGVNPPAPGGLQESRATGYPNDLPTHDYDFHAPIDSTGRSTPALDLLREHNGFLRAFGDRLRGMVTSLPAAMPSGVDDLETLRWALRSDGDQGFVFVNTHRPHEPMRPSAAGTFEIALPDRIVRFPDRPISVPPGTVARWPVGLDLGAVRLDWATASPLTVLPGPVPTLVLRSHPGVVPLAAWSSSGRPVDLPRELPVLRILRIAEVLDVLVLDEATALRSWTVGNDLLLSSAGLWRSGGALHARAAADPAAQRWDRALGRFTGLPARALSEAGTTPVGVRRLRDPVVPPSRYGGTPARAAAPDAEQVDAHAAVWTLDVAPAVRRGGDRLEIAWSGDVAQLRVDGVTVADRFWDGTPWRLVLDPGWAGVLTLHVTPLTTEMPIHLAEAARRALERAGRLCEVHRVVLEGSAVWALEEEQDGPARSAAVAGVALV